MTVIAWILYVLVQLITLAVTIVGWVVLIPFCLAHAWTAPTTKSLKPYATPPYRVMIDRWSWEPLNWLFGNPEDGVSGLDAVIWNSATPPQAVWYQVLPVQLGPIEWIEVAWNAYCWSAWRNSADQLKYYFAWGDGPLIQPTIFGRQIRIGWHQENGYNVPVFG